MGSQTERTATETEELARLRAENERLQTSLHAITGTAKRAVDSMAFVLDLIARDDAPDVRGALERAVAPIVPVEVADRIQEQADQAKVLAHVERRLDEAIVRLSRIGDLHAQLLDMARGDGDGMYRSGARRAAVLLAAVLLAEAWHGFEPADPYAPLDPVDATAPAPAKDTGAAVTNTPQEG